MPASRFRNLFDPEVQSDMDQVPVAPERPQIDLARAQTLARSSRNPQAQRLGNAMLDERRNQREDDARAAQVAQNKAAREAEKAAKDAERAAAKAAEEARARGVREAAAQGAKIETDVATGKRAVATHPDGSPMSEAGPVGKPFLQQTEQAALSSIPGMGAIDQAFNRPPNKQKLDQTQEVAQKYRNDRFQESVQPLPTATDSKTGAITGKLKDEFGAPQTVQLGTDQAVQAKVAKDTELEQRRQEIALRTNRVDQFKKGFTPRWDAVEKPYNITKKALEDIQKMPFRRNAKKQWEKFNPNTGAIVTPDYNETATYEAKLKDAEIQHAAAKAKYDELAPTFENLKRNDAEIEETRLKYVEEKIRHDSGIKEDAPLSAFTSEGKAKALAELSAAQPKTVRLKQQDGSEAEVPMLPLKTQDGQSIHIPMVDDAGKKLTHAQALDQYDQKGTHVKLEEDQDDSDTVSPFTRKLANMDMEHARVQSALTMGKLDPVEGDKRLQVLAEVKGQTLEQAKAEAKATLQAKGREIAAGIIGTGINAQQMAGVEPGGYQKVKGALNESANVSSGVAEALRASNGDIDAAIQFANKQAQDIENAARKIPMDATGFPSPASMTVNATKAVKSSGAAKQLEAMKKSMDAAGIAPADRPVIIQDAAKTSAWTENDTDNLRKLSTGDLVINPGRVFGQKDALIAEINASDATPEAKASGVKRLEAMRQAMAGKIFKNTVYADDDFNEFANQQYKAGNKDKAAILDQWTTQQKGRNPIWKAGDAITEGIKTGSVGVTKTFVGGAAGLSALVGLDGAAATLGQAATDIGGVIQAENEAAKLRGMTGGYAITSELINTVTQMAPMLAGGVVAGGLKGASQIAVRGASAYGWAAAQGYESKLSDALDMAASKKLGGVPLTKDEIAEVLGRPETQVAGFLNAAQTAILAAAFPKGAEAGALGKVSTSMTVSDFLRRGGMRAVKDGTLRQELKAIGKNIFADAKDEALEEFSNQVLDGMISVAALDKEMQLGTLLEDSFKAGALGGVVGGAMPQVYAGQTKQQHHEKLAAALQQQSLATPPRDMVATALAASDPQAKAPHAKELEQARRLIGPSAQATRIIEERRVAYDAAIQAKDYAGAAAIDEQINEAFTEEQTRSATDMAEAVLLHRELSGMEAQAKEAIGQANAALYQAKATGDKQGIAVAEANLEQVTKDAPNVPLARAAVKLATGQDIGALTDSELRSVGYKPGNDGTAEPMSPKELKDAGMSKPLIRRAADGSAVILDEAVEQVIQTSTLAGNRIQLGEEAAMEAAQKRFDKAAKAAKSPTPPPATHEQDPQGQDSQASPPQDSQPAPADANAPIPNGGGAAGAPIQPGAGQQATPEQAPVVVGSQVTWESTNGQGQRSGKVVSIDTPTGKAMVEMPDGTSREVPVAALTGPQAAKSPVSSPAPAIKAKGESAIARAKARFPNLKAKFTVDESAPTGKSGGAYAYAGEVVINTADLEAELAGYEESRHEERIDAIIDEEIGHIAQYEDARRKGEAPEVYGLNLWNGFTKKQKAAALETYQANFDGMDDWQKGFETVRILLQLKKDGKVTELTKAFSKNMTTQMIDMLREAVKFLKSAIENTAENGERISKSIQDTITSIEAILAEYSGDTLSGTPPPTNNTKTNTPDGSQENRSEATPESNAKAPTGQAGNAVSTEGQAPDEKGQVLNPEGGTPENVPPSPDPLQNARDTRETIRQGMEAARKAHPQLVGTTLGYDLEDIVYDMADALAEVPAGQRKGMVDAAIEAWIEDNIAEKPAKAATGTIDQKARRKAWRQAAQDKLNAAARAILNSGVHEAFSAVFQRGKIAPTPNILGLIRKRKAEGKNLTEKEIEIWRNSSNFDGALKKSNYTGGGQNPLARAMIDHIMARQGQGQAPDTIADGLTPKITTASEMWEALAKELRTVTTGKDEDKAGFDPMDDPNYEPSDAEIAAWEAKQEAAARKEDTQPHVTIGDAYDYAVEAFGERSETTGEITAIPPIAQKIGTVADLTDRFHRDDMPAVRAVISTEFQRHAQGMSIPEWDAANPGIMEGPGAGFLKFLRSSTPESLRATLEALPVLDTGSALFSSPSSTGRSSSIDIPPAVIGHSLDATKHPEYAAAKAGDANAALRAARDLVTPQMRAAVQSLIGDSKPVIVPVIAIEAGGNNMIPSAVAIRLEESLGLSSTDEIIQSVRAHRSEKSGLDRVFSQPEFSGPVKSGESYLLVDDTLTQGGTFAALADHITRNGGKVVGAVALTGKQYSATLRLSEPLLAQLRKRLGDLEATFRIATGHGFDRLTESEARTLVSYGPLERVRARILEEGSSRENGLDAVDEGQGDSSLGSSLYSSPSQPGFSFDQTTDAGDKNQKGFNFEAPAATPATPAPVDELAIPVPSYFANNPGNYRLWNIDEEIERTKQVEHLQTTISDTPDQQGSAYTPEMVFYETLNAEEAASGMNGQLVSGKSRGASQKALVSAWVRANQLRNLMAKSKAENPAMWKDYEARQAALAALPVGSEVLTPWPSPPEFPRGTKGTIVKKFKKNWRIDHGYETLVRPEALRPATQVPSSVEAPASTLDTLPPGPLAKFNENTSKQFAAAPEGSKAREEIAKVSAKREGMTTHGKVQKLPQAMMDFGMSGSFGTKDQPGLFASPSNQRSFDFGTTGSFDTKKQRGFDFSEKPTDNQSLTVQPAAESQPVAPQAQPAPTPAAKPGDLADFGEVLPGARKNQQRSISTDISDDDLANQPLSKIWPKAEVDGIEDTAMASIAQALRDEVPAKPRQGYKVARWVKQVKMVRELMRHAEEMGEEALFLRMTMTSGHMADLVHKIRLLREIPREHWSRIGKLSDNPDAYRYERVEGETEPRRIKSPYARAMVDDSAIMADNLESLTAKVKEKLGTAKKAQTMKFEVRGSDIKGYGINKKGDPLYRRLITFPTTKDAFAYISGNYDALASAWEAVKDSDNVKETDVRGKTNRPRAGKDHLQGRDATPEMFTNALGFRGVEFGNWVAQGGSVKDRQGMLNLAFEALHDLADIIGIPPKAISLNGTLGLAFGSRGSGSFSAHYEPDTLVINLTKTRGAGVLAHEFFHALDNYFQMQRPGKSNAAHGGNYITYQPEAYYENTRTGHRLSAWNFNRIQTTGGRFDNIADWKRIEGVRPQVEERFADLVKALDASPMNKRARLIDKGKSDGYWSRVIERAARSFENYTIAKMQQQGYHNDYLANVVSPASFVRDINRYPYLLDDEVAPIVEAFDNLFATIQTKETERGTALFSSPSSFDAEAHRKERETILKTAPRGKDGHPLAPNGERSNLTESQWAEVRTGNFKNWFGDWQSVSHMEFLNGDPVLTLTGDEFKSDGTPLTVKVPKWYEEHGDSIVEVAGIGSIQLDEKSVQNSLSHGIGRNKSAAFAAVPDVLRKGRIINAEPLRGSRDGGMAFHIAAPIRLGATEMVVDVMVKTDPKMSRMWVHEVVATEKLRQAAIKTSADAAEAGVQTGAVAGAIRTMLQDVFAVNPQTVSKVVDENGEPMVVFHGTREEFDAFNASRGGEYGGGIYFSRNPDTAEMFGDYSSGDSAVRVLAGFLRLTAPLETSDRNVPRGKGVKGLKKLGHDGVIGSDAQGIKQYVAFDPTQIKSATANRGSYDGGNPSMLFSSPSPSKSDEAINDDLKDMRKRWEGNGVDSFMSARNGDITLSSIRMPKEMRGEGRGTAAMKELLDYAAENRQRVLLTPSDDFGATSVARLERFYRGLGFEKNAGRNKDFRTRETMIWRYPDYEKRLFSSPSPVDAATVQEYLESGGAPTSAAKTESERVSAALAPSGPDRVADDRGAYSQGDFFAPEQPAAPSPGEQIADAGARAVSRAKARTGRDAVSQDLISGLQGNWEALAREINSRGRASAILANLVNREIPVWNINGTILDTPEAVHAVMLPIRSPYFESLKVMVLDGNNKTVHSQILTVGSVAESSAHPADILGVLARLREVHGKKYTSIIFSHNHPSGDPSPSRADENVTRRLNEIAEIAGWNVIDHIVTNGESYYSFREGGLLGGDRVKENAYAPRKNAGTPVPAIKTEDRQAPWEAVKLSRLPEFDTPVKMAYAAKHLRNGNPDAAHIFYVNAKLKLLAVERVDLQTLLDERKLTQALLAGRGREGAHGFVLDYPAGKTTATILSRRAGDVAALLQMKFIDAVTIIPHGYESGRENGLVMEDPAKFRSSSSQPDLFTAATAPDATEKLGQVKVGTMNALGAYRTLTAKRDAGKTLTGEEEEKLLRAEQALGQKLAFDMEQVKGGVPAVIRNSQTTPRPVFGQNRRDVQDEMSRKGEIDRSGQISLLSSPSPNPDFVNLRKTLASTLTKTPKEYSYAATTENRPEAAGFLAKYGLRPLTPTDIANQIADIERVSGTQIVFFRSRDFAFHGTGSLSFPSVIAINAYSSQESVGYVIAHEMAHVAQRSSNAPTSPIIRKITELVPPEEMKALVSYLGNNGYDRNQWTMTAEVHAHLVGDAVTGANTISLNYLQNRDELRKELVDYFESLPKLKADNQPGQLFSEPPRLLSSPSPDNSAIAQALAKMPAKYREVFAAVTDGMTPDQVAKKHNVTEKAVFNITNQVHVRLRALDEAGNGGLKPTMKDGLLEPGRPERAMSASSPEVARILQIREDAGDPETIANAETYANAKKMIAQDHPGTIERIINRRANGEDLTLDEVAAAQMIILGKIGKKRSEMSEAEKLQLGWLAMDWVEQGTDDARRLQIRRDVTHSPAERAALYFAKELYTPKDPAIVKALQAAKGRKAKEEVMKRFLERSEAIKTLLKKRGIDLEASLEEFRRQQNEKQAQEEAVKQQHDRLANAYQADVEALQQQLAKATAAAQASEAVGLASAAQIAQMKAEAETMAAKLHKTREELSKIRSLEPSLVMKTALLKLTEAERAAMESVINGGTYENALTVSNLTEKQFDKLYSAFSDTMVKAQREAAAMAKQKMLEAPPVLMSSAMEAEINRSLGIVPLSELKARKAPITPEQVRQKPKKTPKAKPAEPVTLTPEQQAAVNATFERFKTSDPSTWTAWWQETSDKLTPMIGQTTFEQFKERVMQPWQDRWQTEMDGIANPALRISMEEWLAKPSTQQTAQRERDLFPQPINETTGTFDTTAPNREGSLFPQPINPATGTWSDTRPFTGQGELIREEINETKGIIDFNDLLARKRLWEEFAGMNATMSDKVFEFWKASILSGPKTAVRNLLSNFGYGAFKLIPRRALEAAVNSSLQLVGLGSHEAATFGEFKVIAKHLRKAAALASRTMISSWQLESPVFEYYAQALEQQIGFNGAKGEPITPALRGKLRTIMHGISFRHMLASDQFAQAYFGHLEAAAQAHRIAKAERMSGKDYEARMDQLMEPGSEAWKRALKEMKVNTFQEEFQPLGAKSIHRFDQAADYIMKLRSAPYLGKPLTLVLPFVMTPANIAKQAIIHSPIGGLLAVADGIRALNRKLSAGKLDSRGMRITREEADAAAQELYDKARFVQDMSNQIIAYGVYFIIAQMIEVDDEDDLPWITGTTGFTAANRGERDTENRVMPPLSIRLPGMGNSYYSYSGLDPLATLIAGTVDVANDVKRTGGVDAEVVGRFFTHVQNSMGDKTYLKGLSDIGKAWSSPDRFIPQLASNIVTGLVPNLIRQPVRALDNVQRDTYPRVDDNLAVAMAKRVGYSVVPQAAPPKLSIWGKPLPANNGIQIGGPLTDFLIRIIDPGNLTIGATINPIDHYIFNWNDSVADPRDKIQITPIDGFISAKIDGKYQKIPLTVAEQHQAITNVGTAASEVLGDDWDYKNTTEEGAKRITDTFTKLKAEETKRIKAEKLAEMR